MTNLISAEVRGKVGIITLNRPDVLNALNTPLLVELAEQTEEWDSDVNVRCIVVTGSARAFAAGADISEMVQKTYSEVVAENIFGAQFDRLSRVRKPIIAAVSGFALGGGCELAMMCDIIIAAESAKFGQPEITLGIVPGLGGTQRLIRAVGKSRALEMCLSGRLIDASEAFAAGLVSRVVPNSGLMEETLALAEKIAEQSAFIVAMVKETVSRAYESSLSEGLLFERRQFHACFATFDQKEGMAAFAEKRKPIFKDR